MTVSRKSCATCMAEGVTSARIIALRRRVLSDERMAACKLVVHTLVTGRARRMASWGVSARRQRGGRIERIVVVVDLHTQPPSLGDPLVLLEAGLVLREEHPGARLELVVLAEPDQRHRHQDFAHLTAAQISAWADVVATMLRGFEHVASVRVFRDRSRLEGFLADAAGNGLVWPGPAAYLGIPSDMARFLRPSEAPGLHQMQPLYLYYPAHNEILHPFVSNHGYLPHLAVIPEIQREADRLIGAIGKRIVVSMNLRSNPLLSPGRNSNFAGWRAFFAFAVSRYPEVGFVVVGTSAEAEQLGSPGANVTVAKREGSSILLDLALISGAAAHLGAGSGPAVMAEFGDKPYSYWVPTILPELYLGSRRETGVVYLSHCRPDQRMITDPETDELILQHGTALLDGLVGR
ncbi:MAG: hypothetical protein Q8O67_18425 [Deltaproteobacteria bacterium]|nr:hypothetical protein [Deltaproteobacteria bacterium]